ncbi:MAG: cyclic nucleotide-binding domain-containing protein, partial [Caldilineaceae bacterium]
MKSELIQYAPLFAGLTEEDRAALDSAFLAGQSAAGSTVLDAGERSEAIYLIGQGFVSLTTSSGQGLATLGPGSILGESSLLAATPMDVSAKALADLSYWKLTD